MTFPPTPTRSWAAGMLVNQRITFVSLLTMLGTFVVGITNQAIAKGFTCAGSCNGVTGAMDGVNRCTTAAGFATRATIAGAAQSWIVITAANGVQTLFTYQGASDDIARISCSPGGLFVAAGTPANQPTATDELVGTSGVTLINATASADRVFDVWIDSAANCWRAAIFRQAVLVGQLIGVEIIDSSQLIGVTCSPSVWIFNHAASVTSPMLNRSNAYVAPSGGSGSGGIAKTSGNAQTQLGAAVIVANSSFTNDSGVLLTANGSVYACRAIGLWSVSTGCIGDIGAKIDWYDSSDISACGALTTGNSWVLLNASSVAGTGGFLWPWDNTTTSCVTS